MLSEEEKRELNALARSERVREEFRLIRALGLAWSRGQSADDVLRFLTSFHRVCPTRLPDRPTPIYHNVRL
jgi:hypothetical protein